MSWKSCSANSEASHSADSTNASGVALPYLASSLGSSEPALTPIRIGVPWSLAARAISLTLSSNFLMLPGFTRTAAHPASIAANTYFGWKWMSAITGICDLRAIAGNASASSCEGQATRTMSQPEAVSSAICCRVAFTSEVSVVVIDCTDTGASPPTPTPPTSSRRDRRRTAIGFGGITGIPRGTADTLPPVHAGPDWPPNAMRSACVATITDPGSAARHPDGLAHSSNKPCQNRENGVARTSHRTPGVHRGPSWQ